MSPSGGIFISYRRQETEHAAGRLADRLAARFGPSRVFMDVDSVSPGADFLNAITEAVGDCDVVLALVGPEWTTLVDEYGSRRLDDPDDFVVLELEVALTRGIPVIPVLIDGATMPLSSDLPASLKRLRYRNAVRLDAETFRSDSGALLEALESILSPTGEPHAPTPRADGDQFEKVAHTAADTRDVDRRLALRWLVGGAAGLAVLGSAVEITRRSIIEGPASKAAVVRPVWSFETGDAVYSSPAVESGTVYVGSNDASLYAIDAESGRQRWIYTTDGAVTSSPAVINGTVFVGSNDARVHAVEAATGSGRWAFETGAAMHSSPSVVGGVVYIGCRDHNLYALDAQTGRERWRFTASDWFNSSPTMIAGVVYIGCRDHYIYAIDAATGRQRWRYLTRSTVDSSPTTNAGTVWIGGDDHAVYALSAKNGQWIWQFDAQGGVDSTPRLWNGVIFVGSDDAHLYALDATTGRMRWAFTTGNGIRSSPSVFKGLVLVGSRDRSLYAISSVTGERQWQLTTDGPIDDSSPAIADGRVFVGSLDHRVYCVEISR